MSLRWFSLCGILVPPVDVLLNVIVAAQQPGYSYLREFISDLAAQGRPFSGVLCVWWALFPLQFGPFALAVYAGLRGHKFARILPTLLVLFGIFIGMCGTFRYDPAAPEHTFSSRVHLVVSGLAGAALFLQPFCLWLATRHDAQWQGFRRLSLLFQVAGALAACPFILIAFRITAWRGLVERCYWGVYYVWMVVLAIRLRRLSASVCAGD